MAKVELKQPIVDEIKALLDGAVAVTAVDYLGLTVKRSWSSVQGIQKYSH